MSATPDQSANYAISSIYGGAGGARTPLASGDTTLLLQPGDGNAKGFPSSFPFYMQIGQVSIGGVSLGTMEIIKVTNRVSDTLTIVRSQEGTSAPLQWGTGTPVVVVNTAGMWANLWTQVRYLAYNARVFGAKGDGVTDDTSAIQAALNAANAAGGGTVYLPAGTYITQTLQLYSSIRLAGDGIANTTLRLKSGTNADLLWGGSANAALINGNAASGTGSNGGLSDWSICDMTLDSNRAGQSSGTSYILRVYGYGFELRHAAFIGGFTGGVLLDWNGNTLPSPDSMEARLIDVKIHDTNGVGLVWYGPHDSQWHMVHIWNTGSHDAYIGVHANGVQASNCHFYKPATGNNSVVLLVEGTGCIFAGSEMEGSDTVQVVLLTSNTTYVGGTVYGIDDAHPASAFQLGQQAGLTPYNLSSFQSGGLTTAKACFACVIDTQITHCVGTNGVFWLANEFQQNLIRGEVWQTSGSLFGSATPAFYDTIEVSANAMPAGAAGSYSLLSCGGHFALQQTSSPQSVATGNTITTVGIGAARVTTSGAVTGVILQAGAYPGQVVTVINESANSITFAASGTSHVADGVSDVIGANTARGFVWDSGPALWYRLG